MNDFVLFGILPALQISRGGPIIAMHHFGWALTLVWILIGNVFIGAVHDYLTLMISVRSHGSSIADIAESTMGLRAKNVFAVFLVLAMLLVIAVFGVVAAKTLIAQPQMVVPTLGIIPVSMLLGWAIYRKGFPLGLCSVLAIAALLFSIYIGFLYPVPLPESGVLGLSPLMFWFVVLMLYAGIASVMPVIRRHEPDSAVQMLCVVPLDEGRHPCARLLE